MLGFGAFGHPDRRNYQLRRQSNRAEVQALGRNPFSSGATMTTFRFTGQRQEAALGGADGLYYYGARWYDPSIMRFIQPDTDVPESRWSTLGFDRYAFVANNPLKYVIPAANVGV